MTTALLNAPDPTGRYAEGIEFVQPPIISRTLIPLDARKSPSQVQHNGCDRSINNETANIEATDSPEIKGLPARLPTEKPHNSNNKFQPVAELYGEEEIEMRGLKARVLTKKEQERFSEVWHNCYSIAQTCKTLKVSPSTFYKTTNANPEFRDSIYVVNDADRKKVEVEMLRLALGHTTTCETEWVRRFDKKTGEPLNDEFGDPLLILKSKKVKRNPPNDNLLLFLAKIYFPDVFGDKLQVTHKFDYENPDELRSNLAKKLLELEVITL